MPNGKNIPFDRPIFVPRRAHRLQPQEVEAREKIGPVKNPLTSQSV
jgi:hypothetical protein